MARKQPKPISLPVREKKLSTWEDDRGGGSSSLYYWSNQRVTVHRYIGYPPDTFFVTCHTLGLSQIELEAKTLEDAKREGLRLVLEHVETVHNAIKQSMAVANSTDL